MSLSMTLKVPQISASVKDNEKKIISENAPGRRKGPRRQRGEWKQVTLLVLIGKLPPGCLTFPSALTQQAWGPGIGWTDNWWYGQGFPAVLIILSLLNPRNRRRCDRERVGYRKRFFTRGWLSTGTGSPEKRSQHQTDRVQEVLGNAPEHTE